MIAGKLLKKQMLLTRIDDGHHIEFVPTLLMRLLLPRLVFRLEPVAERHFRFVAEIFLRAGEIAARLNRREFDAVREHMRIEGINLRRFVEQRCRQAADADAPDGTAQRVRAADVSGQSSG